MPAAKRDDSGLSWRQRMATDPEFRRRRHSVANAEAAMRRGSVPTLPKHLPYRLLASTCGGCGELWTAPPELIRKDSGKRPKCPCLNVRGRRTENQENRRREHLERQRERAREYYGQKWTTDEDYRRRNTVNGIHHMKRINDESRDTATNHGKQWTGPELETVARRDLTAAQAAAMLGRTIRAVKQQRVHLRRDPRKDKLANVSRWR